MQIGREVLRKWGRRIAFAAGALALVWVIAWLAVPPVARWQLQKIASEQLGRQVTVGRIGFEPWSLELTLEDLAVAAADGQGAQLAIKRIYIDGELQSLLRMAPVVDAVTVEDPVIKVRHLGAGRYDFDDVLERMAAKQKPPKTPPDETPGFALYNLTVSGGSLDFQDATVQRTHTLRDLALTVPFISNLPSQRKVKVAPRLAFVLNGSRFDSGAQATPFAQTRRADATLKLAGMDIAPYLGYLPASLPIRLEAATLDVDVSVSFEQVGDAVLRLGGSVAASGVRLADKAGQPLLAFERLNIGLQDVRPLDRVVKLGAVTLARPRVTATRDAAGRINWLGLQGASSEPVEPAQTAAWQFSMASLNVDGANVSWRDAATSPPAQIELAELSLAVNNVAWPPGAPLTFAGEGKLAGSRMAFKGQGTQSAATAELQLTDFALRQAAPYLSGFLRPTLAGNLSADLSVEWSSPNAVVNAKTLSLDGVSLGEGKTVLAGLRRLEVADARIDLDKRTVSVARIALTQPKMKIERDAKGELNVVKWLRDDAPTGRPSQAVARGPAPKPWEIQIADASVDGGSFSLSDLAAAEPVLLEVSALRARIRDFSPTGKKPSPLQLSARVATPAAEAGQLGFNGNVNPQGPAAQGRLDAQNLPLHAFSPYLSNVLNIDLLRARAGFRGQVRYAQDTAGPRVRVSGDASLEDLRANPSGGALAAAGTGQELLSWKTLALRGLEVDMAPGQATRLDVRETALADFFAHISISETGRINLQDIAKQSAETGAPTAPATASASAAVAPGPTSTQPTSTQPPANINFGPITLTGGRVLFADRFVRPNYSADLTELSGKLGAFSSVAVAGAPQMADLELRGRAEGSASLEITGKLNPLAKPLALDIRGKVRDLELPPLSPYSIKYAGHGIERGKLSMDVVYRIQPDGQLTASNNLVLNQLTFSDPVPGAPASLPVRLAVALLADRNGVIDIDLPVSGSLNDPQFSIGPVIFRVIVNLIVKAVTAPFSLLAGALGGNSDEASAVDFVPGTTQLQPDARTRLDKVAQSLIDKPALRLTVVGAASLDVEREAWQRARLRQLLLTEKRRIATLAGRDADAIKDVDAAEYPVLLKAVYGRADMKKPRNVIGMARDLPPAEMEALLLAELPATPDAIRELAVQRGVVVRDYLAARKLPTDRLFLGAPNTAGPGARAAQASAPAQAASASSAPSSPGGGAWKPRAELSLTTR